MRATRKQPVFRFDQPTLGCATKIQTLRGVFANESLLKVSPVISKGITQDRTVEVGSEVTPGHSHRFDQAVTALGSYLEYDRRTDPKAKDDRSERLAAIVRHVESSDPT